MAVPEDNGLEYELHQLIQRHAQLREELEGQLSRVRDVEERFLSLRPEAPADEGTRSELRRRMVLAKPWRDELNVTYRAILATAGELDRITIRIHQIQNYIAGRFARR